MLACAKSKWTKRPVAVKLICLLGISVLVSACSVPTHVVLANVSTQDISVSYRGDNYESVSLAVKSNENAEIKGLLDMRFSIRKEGMTSNYRGEMVPQSYIESVGVGPFLKRVVKARFEDDGCIYLVAIKDENSAKGKTVQPEGFPLCPQPSSK